MTLPILSLAIRLAHDAVYARQKAREVAELLGFSSSDQTRIATAVSEIARNAWVHAGGGAVEFGLVSSTPQVFQIRVRDEGPGIANLNTLLLDEVDDLNSVGSSLIGARSVMDSFVVETTVGAGTVVIIGKFLPAHADVLGESDLVRIDQELRRREPQSPLEELHRQNQDLLLSLNQIREQQEDWERLYREMEATNRDMLTIHDELSSRNQALRESEARFRLMVDEVKDYAIFLLNERGEIITWNVGANRILEYEEQEIVGVSGNVILPPEDRDRGISEQELRTARDGGRAEDERWHVRKNGSRFWANSVVTALWREDALVGYVKILRDTTEQKKAKDSLQDAYQRERHITQVLQSPLIKETEEEALLGLSVVTRYEPALKEADIGGDFFDTFPLPEGRIALAVGDASGKGLEAALRAIQVKELLRAAFALVDVSSPAHVVTQLNKYLCVANQRLADQAAGFVTLALVVLSPVTGKGIFLCAGCEPPLILRANGKEESLHAPAVPLALVDAAQYEDHAFVLAPGDTLVMLTDGVTEARRGHQCLEYEGMITLARQGAIKPTLAEMGDVLLEGARSFAQGVFRDDVCLLLARYA